MNIFEGTRRIVILITIVSAAVFLGYSISNGSDPLKRSMSPEEWMAAEDKTTTSASISPEKPKVVRERPIKSTRTVVSEEPITRSWSDVPGEALSNIPADEQWWSGKWENIWEGALILITGLTVLWVLSWVIGWIVRGFLGIPMGQDRKPETEV